jgi:hypothetical protein
MKKILIVSSMGFGMTMLMVIMVTLVGYLVDVRPDFGIAALCFICLKVAEEFYNEANKEK